MNLISVYGSMYSLIKFIDHNADRSGLPLLVKKRLNSAQQKAWRYDLRSPKHDSKVTKCDEHTRVTKCDPGSPNEHTQVSREARSQRELPNYTVIHSLLGLLFQICESQICKWDIISIDVMQYKGTYLSLSRRYSTSNVSIN